MFALVELIQSGSLLSLGPDYASGWIWNPAAQGDCSSKTGLMECFKE